MISKRGIFGKSKPPPASTSADTHSLPKEKILLIEGPNLTPSATARFELQYGHYFCADIDRRVARLLPYSSNSGPLGATYMYFVAACKFLKLTCRWK